MIYACLNDDCERDLIGEEITLVDNEWKFVENPPDEIECPKCGIVCREWDPKELRAEIKKSLKEYENKKKASR